MSDAVGGPHRACFCQGRQDLEGADSETDSSDEPDEETVPGHISEELAGDAIDYIHMEM